MRSGLPASAGRYSISPRPRRRSAPPISMIVRESIAELTINEIRVGILPLLPGPLCFPTLPLRSLACYSCWESRHPHRDALEQELPYGSTLLRVQVRDRSAKP